jgi:hypothetical protein
MNVQISKNACIFLVSFSRSIFLHEVPCLVNHSINSNSVSSRRSSSSSSSSGSDSSNRLVVISFEDSTRLPLC